MTAERWTQVKTIFQDVIETAPEMRRSFLIEKCADDAELIEEVESMLRFEDDAEEVFEEPVFTVAVKLLAEYETLPLGERLDNYRIVREIGRGGMGAVYLATRDDGLFDQTVALKIIKRGMDTDRILRRFVMERQILASLDHANIARLLDGGTTADGLPYFVMEYVEGLPVDKYCLEKNLNLSERLKLFRKICDGLAYAHQHLVVHRDLKPSNIIVTEDGEPKLLDFGIAKLLHAEPSGETEATETASRFLTPEYASPEQFAGEKITTQSDVFSLGVLLHKLIFGDAKKTGTTEETGTSRTFEKDLRVILETARRTDSARRYSSVEAFSDDIRRLLAGLPVLAQADSFIYRTSKFVRRNATAVALSALAIFALTFAAVFSVWQAQKANAAQARAEKRFNDVRKLAGNVLFDYHDAIEELPNSTEVREKMLKDSLQYLDSLSQEAADDKELLRELGAAYEKVGTIQGNTLNANLNDTPAMLVSYRKSFEIRKKLAALDPDNDEIRRELAIAHENLGDGFAITGELENALEQYQAAWQIVSELAARDEKHLLYLARLHNAIANLQGFPGTNNLGDTAGATENYRKAVEIAQKLYESDSNNSKHRFAVAVYRTTYGDILTFNGDLSGALEQLNLSRQLAEAWAKVEPENTNALNTLTNSYSKISDAYAKLEDYPQAVEFQKKAVAIAEPDYLADPKNARAREIYYNYSKLANLYTKTKDFNQAEIFYQKALEIERKTVDENPTNMEAQLALADTTFDYAALFSGQRQFDKSLPMLEKCLKIYEDAAARDAKNLRVRVSAAKVRIGLGDVYFNKNQFDEALANYKTALPVLQAQAERDSTNAESQKYLSEVQTKISDAHSKYLK